VGDAATLDLTPDAGQSVLDIRAGIINDDAKLDYLQSYVTDIVKQCKR
jgi:prophage endopeptidase